MSVLKRGCKTVAIFLTKHLKDESPSSPGSTSPVTFLLLCFKLQNKNVILRARLFPWVFFSQFIQGGGGNHVITMPKMARINKVAF